MEEENPFENCFDMPYLGNILDEAIRIINGPRRGDYGDPEESFGRIASLWSTLLGVQMTPRQVAMALIGLKLSREVNRHSRDNMVDVCGYAALLNHLEEKVSPRNQVPESNDVRENHDVVEEEPKKAPCGERKEIDPSTLSLITWERECIHGTKIRIGRGWLQKSRDHVVVFRDEETNIQFAIPIHNLFDGLNMIGLRLKLSE